MLIAYVRGWQTNCRLRCELENDYRAMREMFLDEPPPLSVIMEELREVEARINSGVTSR
jgi:hypothetical protein